MQRECLRAATILICAAVFFGVASPASAGSPIGDFFKRLGNSIAHPGQTPPPRKIKKRVNGKLVTVTVPAASATPSPTEIPPPSPPPAATPTPVNVRPADRLARPTKRDMPYGVPVPGRPGFVTSPYAPTVGLVDVRNFPSGTEVKDPYTGKIFLTP